MDELRQRAPFRLVGEDEAVDNMNPEDDERHILDEQEQEKVIQDLRQMSQKSDWIYVQALRMIMLNSIMLQVVFLSSLVTYRHSRTIPTPLSPFFSTVPRPLIPIASGFTFLAITLHILDAFLISSSSCLTPILVAGGFSIPRAALYLLAPFLSVLTGRDLPQTIWWAFPAVVAGLVILMQRWTSDNTRSVEELEGLRYNAPGA
ncbi:hypothetical protein FRB94_014614 [Tulasnella sp. JGI-2019a]|nr:hypothetical protein FRB94_014614 [Tulasnella sp. JGI-2019a]KAG9036730.1 hypothetical protein FRB95_008061 [Tulasnella sp. JGI-2019a]